MRAVLLLTRHELRRRGLGLIVVAVVIAITGGVVLTAFAGARRTDSAIRRFRSETKAADLNVNIFPVDRRFAARIGTLPGVETWGQISPWATVIAGGHQFVSLVPAVDGRFGHAVDRSRLIAGRRARDSHEMVASESLARTLHLTVGDTIRFRAFDKEQGRRLRANTLKDPTPRGPLITLRVVGIDRRAVDFSPAASQVGLAAASNAVFREYHDRVGDFGGLVRVRLRPGASSAHVIREIRRLADGRFLDFDTTASDRAVDDTLRVLAIGLLLFGAIAAVGSIAALSVLIARSHAETTLDQPTWHALGLTTGDRTLAGLLPTLPFVLTGAVGAGLLAILGSWFMPIGLARRVEPARGFQVDGWILGLGVVAILVLGLVLSATLAWRTARRATADTRVGRPLHPSRVTRLAAAAGAPAPTVIGLRHALEGGRGRTAVAVRPALIGAVVGIVGIVGALVVGASIDTLTHEPGRYGWTFDTVVVGDGGQTSPSGPCGPQHSRLERNPEIASLGVVCVTTLVTRAGPLAAYGFRTLHGRVDMPIVRGRAPRTDREIALGEKTIAQLGTHLGSMLHVSGNHGAVDARVVGTAVFPSLEDPSPLAEGALMTPRVLDRIASDNDNSYNHLVIRWRPGTDIPAASQRIAKVSGQRPNQPRPPLEVDRLDQLDALPWLLAGFLGSIALVAVGQAVVANGRRRRREFALLATLGFRGRELRATVRSQAVALMAVGLAIGIPVGLVFGRWAWGFIARDLGVAADPSVPGGAVALLIPAAIAVILAIALVPGRQITRRCPAEALRSE